jgi:hypothetical protein
MLIVQFPVGGHPAETALTCPSARDKHRLEQELPTAVIYPPPRDEGARS